MTVKVTENVPVKTFCGFTYQKMLNLSSKNVAEKLPEAIPLIRTKKSLCPRITSTSRHPSMLGLRVSVPCLLRMSASKSLSSSTAVQLNTLSSPSEETGITYDKSIGNMILEKNVWMCPQIGNMQEKLMIDIYIYILIRCHVSRFPSKL